MNVRTRSLDWNTIQVGDELPALRIDVTATVIVAGALATRDFMPVHHDRNYANVQGAPDIFMNILSSNAYCSRFLTDWAGPEAMVKRLSIRLGVPVHPRSTLTFTGTVTVVGSLMQLEGSAAAQPAIDNRGWVILSQGVNVTQSGNLSGAGAFYLAEGYHQQYSEKTGQHGCAVPNVGEGT